MGQHVIKYEYKDGKKLKRPTLWCGKAATGADFYFQDAQHVALSSGGSAQPCENCIRAIIKELQKEL